MRPEDTFTQYKELNEAERGFRALKAPLGMRPIWHRQERRVYVHIFVQALAFLLDRMLGRALQIVRYVRRRRNGEIKTGVTPVSCRARKILQAPRISNATPPPG